MNHKQLELFISLIDLGSFTKLEEHEAITKQAIIKQINALEEEVGCKLVTRTNHGINITTAGEVFYQGAKDLIKRKDDLIITCKNKSNTLPIIRISQIEYQKLLEPINELFAKNNHESQIIKVSNLNHNNISLVENDLIDIGETIKPTTILNHSIAYTKLVDCPYYVVMHKNHPLLRNEKIKIEQIIFYQTTIFPKVMNNNYVKELRQIFKTRPNNLVIRDDIDNQMEIVEDCSNTYSLLITANPFVHYLDNVAIRPLDNEWTQEYGLVHKHVLNSITKQYLELALSYYSNHHI